MAMAAPVLMAVQAAGKIVGGVMENKAQRRAGRADDENARRTEYAGALEATAALREGRMAAGEDLASFASGGGMLSGTAADMMIANSIEAQRAAMNVRYSARGRAEQLRQQAKDRRHAGKMALVNGFFGAATTAIAGSMDANAAARLSAQGATERAGQLGVSGGSGGTVGLRRGVGVPFNG
jgi:hypothetical protein